MINIDFLVANANILESMVANTKSIYNLKKANNTSTTTDANKYIYLTHFFLKLEINNLQVNRRVQTSPKFVWFVKFINVYSKLV